MVIGEVIPKITFQTRYGNYEFLVMSFGLTNASTTFMGLINRVFWSYLDSFVIVFIDDVWVYSKNESDHMNHLRMMSQVLKENQLFSKYSKCEFLLRSVVFFGHIISTEGFEIIPTKTEAVKNWPRPLNPTDIKSFLGRAGYYRRFVIGFTSIASPWILWPKRVRSLIWRRHVERPSKCCIAHVRHSYFDIWVMPKLLH